MSRAAVPGFVVTKQFAVPFNGSLQTFKPGYVVTQPYLIDFLKDKGYPVQEATEKMHVVECPHCKKSFIAE